MRCNCESAMLETDDINNYIHGAYALTLRPADLSCKRPFQHISLKSNFLTVATDCCRLNRFRNIIYRPLHECGNSEHFR